ncbi:hypothetical protein DF185_04210 [Marinifilum breve]|uniref:MPN domain-containing protein n=1 Tax=Marinifilum breve TaxID=2184082 RepID=A0A2V3ZZY8_9BACT|nr:JAB domain-containing protein [Marinifilum breve]PXY01861.1 hypothetical protein DF185_04210 [Marinifilum breve]
MEGGTSSVTVDPKLVFQFALKCNASNIILMHNHTSRILMASDADIQITRKLAQEGELMDLPMIDHLIFSS